MKPNIQKLNEVLETRFNNNKSEFAKALNIDRGQFCKILKEGNYTGTVFWSGLLIYCKSNCLNFEDFIIFESNVKKINNRV